MKSLTTVCALLLVLACQSLAQGDQICQPPKVESVFFRVNQRDTMRVYRDYDQNKFLLVFGDSVDSERWSLLDLNAQMTYENFEDKGCLYLDHRPDDERLGYELFERCLPSDAKLLVSGELNMYSMERPTAGISWLVGMKPLPDSEFYVQQFSKLLSVGTDGVGTVDTYGVVYETTIGLSDPTIFDKDLSGCIPGSAVN